MTVSAIHCYRPIPTDKDLPAVFRRLWMSRWARVEDIPGLPGSDRRPIAMAIEWRDRTFGDVLHIRNLFDRRAARTTLDVPMNRTWTVLWLRDLLATLAKGGLPRLISIDDPHANSGSRPDVYGYWMQRCIASARHLSETEIPFAIYGEPGAQLVMEGDDDVVRYGGDWGCPVLWGNDDDTYAQLDRCVRPFVAWLKPCGFTLHARWGIAGPITPQMFAQRLNDVSAAGATEVMLYTGFDHQETLIDWPATVEGYRLHATEPVSS